MNRGRTIMNWRRITTAAVGLVALALLIGGILFRGGNDRNAILSAGMTLFPVERSLLIRTVAAEGYLHAIQATPISVPVEVEGVQRVAWIAPDGAEVREGDKVILFDSGDLELKLADGQDDLEIAFLNIQKSSNETRTKLENLFNDLSMAEREEKMVKQFAPREPLIFSRNEILESEIDLELARDRARNTRSRGEAIDHQGQTNLDLLDIEKSKAELKVKRAEEGLTSLEVNAPHAGMLVLERNWNGEMPRLGDEVWPGQKIAEIPDPSRMMARVYVLEADAGGLKAGCRATLTVEAHPGKKYPAHVDRVDALAKKRHWNVPVQYFEAVIIPDETDLETMKPGQRVRAEIVLEEISDALMVPPQAIFEKKDRQVVYRAEESRLVAVEVTLGPRSLSRVQILQGVKEGDRVALRDPRRSPEETLERPLEQDAAPYTPEKSP